MGWEADKVIICAFDSRTGLLGVVQRCGITVPLRSVGVFCDAVISSLEERVPCSAESRSLVDDLEGGKSQNRSEVLLASGTGCSSFVISMRGFERATIANEVLLIIDGSEFETFVSFIRVQRARAQSVTPCGGGHYRDWKKSWRSEESDVEVHIDRGEYVELNCHHVGEGGGRIPPQESDTLMCDTSPQLLGLSREAAVGKFGEPCAWFPSLGSFRRSVAIWRHTTLWFGTDGVCRLASVKSSPGFNVAGVHPFDAPYRKVRGLARNAANDLVAGKTCMTSASMGFRIVAPKRWSEFRRAESVQLCPAEDVTLAVEGLRSLARKVFLDCRLDQKGILGWLFRAARRIVRKDDPIYSIDTELDRGNWSFACASFVIYANELGLTLGSAEYQFVERLCRELGVEERLIRKSASA